MILPIEHIEDSQKLSADAEIELFELTPAGGGATMRFKNDNTVTWLGNEYVGLPLEFSGETHSAENGMSQPQLTIGQPDINLSMFKGLIHDGLIDGARVDKHTVLLHNLINNINIKVTRTYKVKRPDSYGVTSIILVLSTFSVAGPSTMPFRQFLPPAFPFVTL
jgi:phage-related protein